MAQAFTAAQAHGEGGGALGKQVGLAAASGGFLQDCLGSVVYMDPGLLWLL